LDAVLTKGVAVVHVEGTLVVVIVLQLKQRFVAATLLVGLKIDHIQLRGESASRGGVLVKLSVQSVLGFAEHQLTLWRGGEFFEFVEVVMV